MYRLLFSTMAIAITAALCAQSYVINGSISDTESGEELIGASVFVDSLLAGTMSNVYGFYSLELPAGRHTVKFSYLGYRSQEMVIDLTDDLRKDVSLSTNSMTLSEVVVKGEKEDKQLDQVQMSVQRMSISEIKKIPAFMGEVDIIRAIQMLPGVQTVGEGSTGMYVRGGSADENLILLDEAPVYNAAHMLGIFSTFNSDAIKDVQLYKGGIPARYGGRLSSVLDIRMKEGNDKRFAGSGGIGTVSSRLTLEAPIVKDRGSFMVAGRRTYADVFLLFSSNPENRDSQAYFYDLNLKANYRLGPNDRIFLSGFFGRDVFGDSGDDGFRVDWGNTTSTLRWNHIYGSRLFSNLTLFFSDYDYQLGDTSSEDAFSWVSKNKNLSAKLDYHFTASSKSTLRFGLQTIQHTLKPGEISSEGTESIVTGLTLEEDKALEHGVYLSHEYSITDALKLDYGLRFSAFQNLGKATVYDYDDQFELTDTAYYGAGKVFNTYTGLEPRLGLRYRIDNNSSVKLGYHRMNQYIHLASNSTSITPFDIYFPSSPNVEPRQVDQIGVGYFRNFEGNKYEASVELYYKEVGNSLDFKDHAQIFFNEHLEAELRFGTSRAMGLELLMKKNEGRLTGFVSYTAGKVTKKIDGVNGGKRYNANYDRPHDLAVVASYAFNDRWSFGANFILQSGRAITVPSGRMIYGNTSIPVYSDRNEARLPLYHRLDLSATLQGKKNKDRKWQSEWVFSVYNAYFRKNAFAVAFVQNEEDPPQAVARKTYLFPIIPSVTYNFKF